MKKRCLWVDTLCIIQDDERDKQQQLPIMDAIYSCADIIIIAATGSDVHPGIPGAGNTRRRIIQGNETINGISFVTTPPEVQQVLDSTKWSRRGWTYQDAILARRALIFTDSLVYWNCRTAVWREDISGESLDDGLT